MFTNKIVGSDKAIFVIITSVPFAEKAKLWIFIIYTFWKTSVKNLLCKQGCSHENRAEFFFGFFENSNHTCFLSDLRWHTKTTFFSITQTKTIWHVCLRTIPFQRWILYVDNNLVISLDAAAEHTSVRWQTERVIWSLQNTSQTSLR